MQETTHQNMQMHASSTQDLYKTLPLFELAFDMTREATEPQQGMLISRQVSMSTLISLSCIPCLSVSTAD